MSINRYQSTKTKNDYYNTTRYPDFPKLPTDLYIMSREQDRLDMLYDELQTPLLVMILFFAFNLPYVNKTLIRNMPSLFQRDGNPSLSGYLFKTVAFGVSFYGITRASRYLSEY